MIKSQRQLKVSKDQLSGFEVAYTQGLESLPATHIRLRAMESVSVTLRRQIREFEALLAGDESAVIVNGLHDLPKALIQLRILRGLTQKALAEKLGVKAQQVQRWEHEDYENISFSRLEEIAEVLGLARAISVSARSKVSAASASSWDVTKFNLLPIMGSNSSWNEDRPLYTFWSGTIQTAANDGSAKGDIELQQTRHGPTIKIKGCGPQFDGSYNRASGSNVAVDVSVDPVVHKISYREQKYAIG